MWSCYAGRGRKIRAKVGGVSDGGKCIEEKDKDEEQGKGKAEGIGKVNAEERVEGNGKAQEGTKGEEKPNERKQAEAGDESVFDLDPPHGRKRASALVPKDVVDPSALDLGLHLTLDSQPWTPTQQNKTSQTRQSMTSPPSAPLTAPQKP